jgi:uncharacterized heparinase superfamily protein
MPLKRKFLQKLVTGTASLTYGNPLYQRSLAAGPVPENFVWLPKSDGGGDAALGAKILQTQFCFGTECFSGWPPPWQPDAASDHWLAAMHGFGWLQHLESVGTPQAQQACCAYIGHWLEQAESWRGAGWMPEVIGARLTHWVRHAAFYLPSMELPQRQLLLTSLARQARHLARLLPNPRLVGTPALMAVRGLIEAGLNLPADGGKLVGLALTLLARQLTEDIAADGGHKSRSPQQGFDYLRHLLAIRAALAAQHLSAPAELDWTIRQMVPALRSLRHGDGGFALFHGGQTLQTLLIDRVLEDSGVRHRGGKSLPQSGFERLQAGRCLLLADMGLPPVGGYDQTGHAGLLSFEFSHGRERIFTNCGALSAWGSWRMALAATAAHNALQVGDTNAAEILPEGGLGRRPKQATSRLMSQQGAQTLIAAHDGYKEAFGLVHERSLSLGEDGAWLKGQDVLYGAGVYPYTIRFHLHPKIQASQLNHQQTVLLRCASGQGWKFTVDGGRLQLEESLYCGQNTPRRSLQIAVTAQSGGDLPLHWLLQRLEKNA